MILYLLQPASVWKLEVGEESICWPRDWSFMGIDRQAIDRFLDQDQWPRGKSNCRLPCCRAAERRKSRMGSVRSGGDRKA